MTRSSIYKEDCKGERKQAVKYGALAALVVAIFLPWLFLQLLLTTALIYFLYMIKIYRKQGLAATRRFLVNGTFAFMAALGVSGIFISVRSCFGRCPIFVRIKLLDQYGNPVPGVKIKIYKEYLGRPSDWYHIGIPQLDDEFIATSNSRGEVFSYSGISLQKFIVGIDEKEAVEFNNHLYVAYPGAKDIYFYYFGIWWYNNSQNNGVPIKYLPAASPVIIRMYRLEKPERIARLSSDLHWTPGGSLRAWLDIPNGKWTDQPCTTCDLAVELKVCGTNQKPGRYSGWKFSYITQISSPTGEVRVAPMVDGLTPNNLEVAETEYLSSITFRSSGACEAEYPSAILFPPKSGGGGYFPHVDFHSRAGSIYGVIQLGGLSDDYTHDRWIWHSEVRANPRGSRNLYNGQLVNLPFPFPWPLLEPYWVVPSRIHATLIASSKGRILAISSENNAAPGCDQLAIAIEGDIRTTRIDNNGSFSYWAIRSNDLSADTELKFRCNFQKYQVVSHTLGEFLGNPINKDKLEEIKASNPYLFN